MALDTNSIGERNLQGEQAERYIVDDVNFRQPRIASLG